MNFGHLKIRLDCSKFLHPQVAMTVSALSTASTEVASCAGFLQWNGETMSTKPNLSTAIWRLLSRALLFICRVWETQYLQTPSLEPIHDQYGNMYVQQPNTHTCSIDSDTHTSLTTESWFIGWRDNSTLMHVGTVRQWSWGWQLMYLMLVRVPHVPGSSAPYSI